MKKLLAVAALLVAVVEAHAHPAPIYRWRWTPNTSNGSFQSAYLNDNQIIPGPATLNNGWNYLEVKLSTCQNNSQNPAGFIWEEESFDNGVTWVLLTPTYTGWYMPDFCTDADQAIQTNTTSGGINEGPINHLQDCPMGG